MPRRCLLCRHPERAAIEEAVVSGEPNRRIASRAGVSEAAVRRHGLHIPKALAKAHEAHEAARADDLLGQMRELQARTLALLADAEREGDTRGRAVAIHQARENVALLTRLMAELAGKGGDGFAGEWPSLRERLLAALAPFPEASAEVAKVIRGEAGG